MYYVVVVFFSLNLGSGLRPDPKDLNNLMNLIFGLITRGGPARLNRNRLFALVFYEVLGGSGCGRPAGWCWAVVPVARRVPQGGPQGEAQEALWDFAVGRKGRPKKAP